jgi:hypothetical protein
MGKSCRRLDAGGKRGWGPVRCGGGGGGERGAIGEEGLQEVEMGIGLGLDATLYTKETQ